MPQNFRGISLWQKMANRALNYLSLMDPPIGSLLRTDAHVSSGSALCVGGITTPVQPKHGRQSSLKYGTRRHSWTSTTSRADQCHSIATSFQATQRPTSREKFRHFLGSTEPWPNQIHVGVSDIECWTKINEQTCLENAKEVTEYANQFQ